MSRRLRVIVTAEISPEEDGWSSEDVASGRASYFKGREAALTLNFAQEVARALQGVGLPFELALSGDGPGDRGPTLAAFFISDPAEGRPAEAPPVDPAHWG